VAGYNSRFSVGEHCNGAELWFDISDVLKNWERLDEDVVQSKSIPFHFLNFEQVNELQPDMPFGTGHLFRFKIHS